MLEQAQTDFLRKNLTSAYGHILLLHGYQQFTSKILFLLGSLHFINDVDFDFSAAEC